MRVACSALASFTLLHGDLADRPDTAAFLVTLSRLQEEGDLAASDSAAQPTEREKLAAATLFRWEDEVVVARAPGRLDVMGGIADYSGSLVLQMPTKEAAHVALQRTDPGERAGRRWTALECLDEDESAPLHQQARPERTVHGIK